MSANKSLDDCIDVVGLVLFSVKTSRVAVFRRGPEDSGAGHWEFPGGKVDDGETKEQALSREIEEELELKIKSSSLHFVADIVYKYPTKKIHLFLYLATAPDENIKFKLTDHDQFQWVEISGLKQINFSPADLALIPAVQTFLKTF